MGRTSTRYNGTDVLEKIENAVYNGCREVSITYEEATMVRPLLLANEDFEESKDPRDGCLGWLSGGVTLIIDEEE